MAGQPDRQGRGIKGLEGAEESLEGTTRSPVQRVLDHSDQGESDLLRAWRAPQNPAGTMDGYFKALDARNGQELWRFKVGSGIIGQPVTYRGPDGKQYVAVLSGVGGWPGAIVAGGLDPRDSTAALGFADAMKDLPQYSTKGGTLYVFSH